LGGKLGYARGGFVPRRFSVPQLSAHPSAVRNLRRLPLEMTMNVYGHVDLDSRRDAPGRLAGLIGE
jgi:hypothetical protein